MRDCANCFHRKPVLKEDGTWTAECEKWDCEFQSRENMIEKTKAMNNDLISRSALIQHAFTAEFDGKSIDVVALIDVDNAPTVETFTKEDMAGAYNEGYACGSRENERPKGEWHYFDEYLNGGTFYITECPFCHLRVLEITNFCPDCGADMRGEDK